MGPQHAGEPALRASDLGDYRFNDKWPDASIAAIQKSHDEDQQALADLLKIDHDALRPQDEVSYDLFKWQINDGNDSFKFHEYLFPLNQLGGIQTVGEASPPSRCASRR